VTSKERLGNLLSAKYCSIVFVFVEIRSVSSVSLLLLVVPGIFVRVSFDKSGERVLSSSSPGLLGIVSPYYMSWKSAFRLREKLRVRHVEVRSCNTQC
jgi:hypothetical protein